MSSTVPENPNPIIQDMSTFKYSYKFRSKETVSLAVYNVGYERCAAGQTWSGKRDHYLIHHVTAGKGSYLAAESNGTFQKHELVAGDTFLVRPGVAVTYAADNEEPWEYCWVGFYGSDAKLLLERTDFASGQTVISTCFENTLSQALMNIVESRGESEQALVRMTGYLYIALAVMMQHSKKNAPPLQNSLFYAQKAGEYISEHYREELTVALLAQKIGVSRSYLFRIFQEYYGVSPKEFLTSVRINAACRLLKQTALSVGQIAATVGYPDGMYFSSVFKKSKGVCPSEYRKN